MSQTLFIFTSQCYIRKSFVQFKLLPIHPQVALQSNSQSSHGILHPSNMLWWSVNSLIIKSIFKLSSKYSFRNLQNLQKVDMLLPPFIWAFKWLFCTNKLTMYNFLFVPYRDSKYNNFPYRIVRSKIESLICKNCSKWTLCALCVASNRGKIGCWRTGELAVNIIISFIFN